MEMLRIVFIKQLAHETMYAHYTVCNAHGESTSTTNKLKHFLQTEHGSHNLDTSVPPSAKSTKDAVIMLSQATPTAFMNSWGLC